MLRCITIYFLCSFRCNIAFFVAWVEKKIKYLIYRETEEVSSLVTFVLKSEDVQLVFVFDGRVGSNSCENVSLSYVT